VPDEPATSPAVRLAWLDALRGIAAMLVVYEHLAGFLFHRYGLAVERWFLPGYAGVCLFFLVSGYIIPASLERRGSLRGFWVGRFFRLYPLFVVALVLLVLLDLAGLRPLAPKGLPDPVDTVAAHSMMLPSLLGMPDILGVTWTLAFEMAFYLLVAGLFAVGLRRASPVVALLLAGTALAVGGAMRTLLLSHSALGAGTVVALALGVFGLALAGMLSGRRRLAVAGGVLGGLFAVVLLLTNQNTVHKWDGLLIPALMFTGTTIYRAEQRQISRWWALAVPLAVAGVWAVQNRRELDTYPPFFQQFWPRVPITLAVVAALFAAGMALRHRRIPALLAWLGLVSYSIYLMHLLVLEVAEGRLGGRGTPSTAPGYVQLLLAVTLVGLVLATSWCTYRYVEAPGQRLGRVVARRLDARFGSDTRPRPAPSAVPVGVAGEPGDLVRLE
jgi:peptidoglycan/LPS O-acetylase OafA/YrhL